MFTHSAITLPEVNGFGWNLGNSWVYCLELAMTDFGRDPRRSESGRPCRSFVFCQVNKTRLPISGQPIFTKFAHKTCFCDAVNPLGNIFWKFALNFFSKNLDHPQWFPTSCCNFLEMITNLGTWWQVGAPMECWLSIRTVGINSVIRLASSFRTRKDFPMRSFAMIYILKMPSNNAPNEW